MHPVVCKHLCAYFHIFCPYTCMYTYNLYIYLYLNIYMHTYDCMNVFTERYETKTIQKCAAPFNNAD